MKTFESRNVIFWREAAESITLQSSVAVNKPVKMMLDTIWLVSVLGLLSTTSCDPYRFILIEELKTWPESQSYCREKHTDLATVQSDEDRAELKEAADAANFGSFAWIGFYNGVLTWRWSYQDQVISYEQWESWEPDEYRTREACAFINKQELWGDTSCLEEKYFFCQTDKNAITEKFIYVQLSMKWRDAQLYCRTNHMDLATIADGTENKNLASIITDNNGWDAWIGLSKNLWLWSDRTNVSWSLVTWQSGQPDNVNGQEECACAGTEGQMADDSCSTQRFFYCKTPDDPPVKKIKFVRVAVKSAGSLDEYAVMAAIEKKVNQMLSEQNMDTGSNVTWRVHPDGKIFHLQESEAQKTTTTACEEKEPMKR